MSRYRSAYRTFKKYGRKVGTAIGAYAAARRPNNRSMTRTKRGKRKSGTGVTEHRDNRQIYSRTSMPKGKKRKWVSQVRKVNAILGSNLGTRSVVRNGTVTYNWNPTLLQQAYTSTVMYGMVGTSDAQNTGYDDLYTIIGSDPDLSTAVGSPKATKAMFTACILDLTFENTGSEKLEVDVYEFISYGNVHLGNFALDLAAAQTRTLNIPTFAAGLNLADRGVTPFEFPQLTKQGYKWIKKTKFFVAPDSTFTMQNRDSRNRFIDSLELSARGTDKNFSKSGWTRGYVFIAKALPGATVSAVSCGYAIGITRKYGYKILEDNADYDGGI